MYAWLFFSFQNFIKFCYLLIIRQQAVNTSCSVSPFSKILTDFLTVIILFFSPAIAQNRKL